MYWSCSTIIVASVLIGLTLADVNKFTLVIKEKTCLIAEIDADVVVQYETKGGTSVTTSIPIPADSKIEGTCALLPKDKNAELIIIFNNNTQLTLNFTDTDNGVVTLSGLEFMYHQDSPLFPNASATGVVTATNTDSNLPMGDDKQYFQCHSKIVAEINSNVSVDFASMKVQTFNVNGDFSKDASICAQDQPTPKPTATPSPPPAPTMPPIPKTGNWSVKADNGTVCIVAQMGVRFIIPYVLKDKKNATAIVDLPTDALSTDSLCGELSQDLELTFYTNWTLRLHFVEEAASSNGVSSALDEYSVHNISLVYTRTLDMFPNALDPDVEIVSGADGLDLFRTGKGMSFFCQSKQAESLSKNVTMDTYSLHLQAFKYDNGTAFVGTVVECPKDSITDSVVPIAVGAALAALVAIVLVAYIIGRKRSRTGYESV